jgi:hypothetical protein
MATTNTQPKIEVIFKQLALSAVNRGARGRVGLIIFDDTDKTFTTKTYKLSSEVEVDNALYTVENAQFIKDCFIGIPASVTVIRADKIDGNIADALTIVKGLRLDWIGTASEVVTDQTAVSSFIKEQEALKKQFKSVVFNPSTTADCKHVVTLANSKVTFTDNRGEKTGNEYVPSLLGIFAGLALNRSATYLQLNNLKSVVEEADIDTSIQAGKLVLFNDDTDIVKISTAVNSLITLDINNTADMTKIEVIEIMDLMYYDIVATFKNSYVGKYKNKTDYQYLFLSAVNSYFETLEGLDLLDNLYDNKAKIDVEAVRLAWLSVGKVEAETWTEEQVIANAFKNQIFLTADVKILQAMEGLKFVINMA